MEKQYEWISGRFLKIILSGSMLLSSSLRIIAEESSGLDEEEQITEEISVDETEPETEIIQDPKETDEAEPEEDNAGIEEESTEEQAESEELGETEQSEEETETETEEYTVSEPEEETVIPEEETEIPEEEAAAGETEEPETEEEIEAQETVEQYLVNEADFTYSPNDDGTFAITGYTGSEINLIFPSMHDGHTVVSIASNAFKSNTALQSAVFPDGLTTIDANAFNGCTSLSHVEFPDSLLSIGSDAFNGCPIEDLVLPAKVQMVYAGAFNNNNKLTSITIPKTLVNGGSIIGSPFRYCSNLKEVIFEEGTTSIALGLFANVTALEKATIPEGVTVIKGDAFKTCTGLKELTLPSTLQDIQHDAFNGCTSLSHVEFPESLLYIGSDAFKGCPIEDLVLPAKVQMVYAGAFSNNTKLTSIVIPKTLVNGGSIVGSPFRNCANLKEVSFEEGTTSIAFGLFASVTSLEKAVIPVGVTEIKGDAFKSCTGLKELTLPGGVASIGSNAFNGCTSLSHVEFPDSLLSIGSDAFKGCPIEALELPAYVQTVFAGAFSNNSRLTSIVIPKTLVNGGSILGSPFKNCSNLKKAVFEDGTTATAPYLFSTVSSLERVDLPEGVTTIGLGSFSYCTSLKSVDLPDTVTTVLREAFANCTGLRTVSIPDSVVSIHEESFKNCSSLTILTNYDAPGVVHAINYHYPYEALNSRPSSARLIQRDSSFYHADPAGFMINGSLPCTVTVSSLDEYAGINDRMIDIYVPESAVLDLNHVTFNGKAIQGSFDSKTRIASFTLDDYSGSLRFNLQFSSNERSDTYAVYRTRKGVYDVVGSFNNVFTGVSLIAPDQTSETTVSVSGIAPSLSEVELYVDGELQTTVTAKKNGSYHGSVNVPDSKEYFPYTVTAKKKGTSDDKEIAEKTVTYFSGTPEIRSFIYDDRDGKELKQVELLDNSTLRIFQPSQPYKFELEFTHPESIGKVYVKSIKGTDARELEAVYDSTSGKYIAEGWFGGSRSYVPGHLTVTYTPNRSSGLTSEQIVGLLNSSIPEIAGVNMEYEVQLSDEVSATIDISDAVDEFENTSLKLYFKHQDSVSGADIASWFGTAQDVELFLETWFPGFNEEKYVFSLEKADDNRSFIVTTGTLADPLLKIVNDVNTIRLDMITDDNSKTFWELSDKFAETKNISTNVQVLYKVAKIAEKHEELRKKIMYESGMSDEEKKIALSKLDELSSDKAGFTVLYTIGTLALSAVGGPYAIIFSVFLAAMKLASEFAYQYREEELLVADADVKIKTDPSGYVYDTRTEERIEGVTTTAYWVEYDFTIDEDVFFANPPADTEYGTVWDASEYEQKNPLTTDYEGRYQWDVPTGWWRVKYEKEGYETTWSEWLPVPPPQMEVNVGLRKIGGEIPLERIELDQTELKLQKGKTAELKVTFVPEDTTVDKTVIWASTNPAVATVDNGTVTAVGIGTATITAKVGDLEPAECELTVQFSDVTDPELFYYGYVYNMVERGVVGGYDDGTFRPTANCNRAAVVTFLWRLSGKPEPNKMAEFTDMTGNSDFDKAISWAAENNITTGWADNTFRPWNTCNRAAVMTFLWRAAGKPAPTKMAEFTDMTGNTDFDTAISWASEKGITTGWADGTFRPWNTCNRLAVVSFLGRYNELKH
ncbi:MAG: leucine-rich repeat protein [Solobacterium sp.]|nr:leucine-rich repeat protein [Solobacterium sp.]